ARGRRVPSLALRACVLRSASAGPHKPQAPARGRRVPSLALRACVPRSTEHPDGDPGRALSPVHFSRWPLRSILPPATRGARTALVRVNSLSQFFRRTLKRYEEGLRMRTRLLLAAVVLALPGTTPARADHIKDPAEVMPAKSVVYVELHQPGQLVKEIASLFE